MWCCPSRTAALETGTRDDFFYLLRMKKYHQLRGLVLREEYIIKSPNCMDDGLCFILNQIILFIDSKFTLYRQFLYSLAEFFNCISHANFE